MSPVEREFGTSKPYSDQAFLVFWERETAFETFTLLFPLFPLEIKEIVDFARGL